MYSKVKKNNLATKAGLGFALIGSATMVATPVLTYADTSQEISQEKQKVDDIIKKIQDDMKLAEAKVSQMKNDFDSTEKEIELVDKEIKDTQARIEARSEIIGSRLLAMQQNESGLNPFIEVVFGADNFSDLLNRVFAVSKIIDADNQLLEEQTKDQVLQEEQKEGLVKKKKDLEKQFQTLQEEHSKLETQKAEQEALSLQLGNKLENAKEREEREKKAKEAEARAARLASLQKSSFERQSVTSTSFSTDVTSSDKSSQIINEASKYMGYKYVWGGSTPSTSFDCSGLTQWSFKKAGINLPRTAAQQYLATERISMSEAKPGDLVFFSYGSGIAHVGIYIGNGKMINAQNSGLKVADLGGYWEKYIAGFGRVSGVN